VTAAKHTQVVELVPNASIVGNRVELGYSSHLEAFEALREIRSRLEQRDQMLALLERAQSGAYDATAAAHVQWLAQVDAAIATATGAQA